MKPEFNKKAGERLRMHERDGHSLHTIEAGNPRSLALLEKAYKEVYEAAFPIDEERESLQTWQDNLDGKNSSVNIVIVVAGDNLDSEKPTLKAISVAYYYVQQDAGLLAYNAVLPAYQGQGFGRIMVDSRKQALLEHAEARGKFLGGVFIECNDPAKVAPADDVMDPAVRIKIFEKWGAMVLPIDYVQPPLTVGGDKCDTLKLLAYPHPKTGLYPDKNEIAGYLKGIYTELAKYSGMPAHENPDYLKSVEQLNKLDLDQFYRTALTSRAAKRATAANNRKPPANG